MKKGFTLIEVVLVVVIVAIIAAIGTPRIISLRKDARQSACDGNVATIRAAVLNYYTKTATEGTATFPTTLHLTTFVNNYFASETLPTCPFSASLEYNYNSTTGVVRTHSHL
jgi:prepilin-type N-terminal cleavage/methylation domain-containing protein